MSWFDSISALAHSVCGAETVEVVVQSDEAIELRWSDGPERPTGFQATDWFEPQLLVPGDNQPQNVQLADWVASAAVVPLTNASADLGWMIIASQQAGAFTEETLTSLSRFVELVEAQLDATVINDELALLTGRLHDSERVLADTRAQLEISNRELEQFAYIAAHELVAPLRSVAVYAEVLATLTSGWVETKPAEVNDIVGEIRDGVQRMTGQVQYLLALSKAEQTPGELALVDTTRTAFGAVDTLTELYADADANVTVDPLPAVAAQDIPLQSVFANLLTNAVRYRVPSRPLHVHIGASHEPDGINIEIADNAAGISEEAQHRIFGLFERASTDGDGLGVGLAVSRRILEGFGASISVTSSDEGSTFVLHFPRPGNHMELAHT